MRAAIAWQATTVAATGIIVGLLRSSYGIGHFIWNVFATELGVVSDPVAPFWPRGLLVVAATVLLANLVALLPGRLAAGTQPALLLRAE